MIVECVTVVPVEFFRKLTKIGVLDKVENKWVATDDAFYTKAFAKIIGSQSKMFECPKEGHDITVVLGETSACFVLRKRFDLAVLSEVDIVKILEYRYDVNNAVTSKDKDINPLCDVLSELLPEDGYRKYSWPSYAFSYWVASTDMLDIPEDVTRKLKVLSEPSVVEADDVSMERASEKEVFAMEDIEQKFFDDIVDCDVSRRSEVYVTWASIGCLVRGGAQDFAEIDSMLCCLEVRLQMIWNKCYAIRRLVEDVFREKFVIEDLDSFMFLLSRTVEGGYSVMSSTISTRGNKILKEMIRTSQLEEEIEKLNRKFNLMERYVTAKEKKRTRNYERAIELFLFVMAAVSIIDFLFGIPILSIEEEQRLWLSSLTMAGLAILGIFLVVRK
ncbi:hypothetical protein HED22_09415 [Thalassospira sp. HF15]|uniref:hypothetical protein n=1 Tax=Thalassospira sp. HF15 TaxID=2722755 RepID=UPI001431D1A2|nr:hypothetical protein [Thalassospira sp. HF15]NIY75861.1 hypothetical protein [Thalassospira sp. HF15]